MWITILSDNFKDLLETLKTKPTVIIVLSLMFLAGFFINKWVDSQDTNLEDLKARDKEALVVTEKMYEYKYEAMYWKNMYNQNVKQTDSLLRDKLVKPLENLNK